MSVLDIERGVYPTDFAPEFRPFTPDDDLGEAGSAAVRLLANHGFVVAEGVLRSQVSRLGEIAQEPHIVEYCPKDPVTRFGDVDMVTAWLEKGRVSVPIYEVSPGKPLTTADIRRLDEGDVSTIVNSWWGREKNKHIPSAPITSAFRTSQRGRELGRELGIRFGALSVDLVLTSAGVVHEEDLHEFSLENWKSNRAGGKLYEAKGFVLGAEPMEDERPTLKNVGDEIDGNVVYVHPEKLTNYVRDTRMFQILNENHPMLVAA
jgi:hypothetical protein